MSHTKLPAPPPLAKGALRLFALGGLGEIGRNMTVFEFAGQLLIVDCGVLFPEESQPGVDLILPDFGPIVGRMDDIVGLVLTHGHEDHIGAVPVGAGLLDASALAASPVDPPAAPVVGAAVVSAPPLLAGSPEPASPEPQDTHTTVRMSARLAAIVGDAIRAPAGCQGQAHGFGSGTQTKCATSGSGWEHSLSGPQIIVRQSQAGAPGQPVAGAQVNAGGGVGPQQQSWPSPPHWAGVVPRGHGSPGAGKEHAGDDRHGRRDDGVRDGGVYTGADLHR